MGESKQVKSVTIVIPHYFPETNAAAKRAQALAQTFVQQGFRTCVITQAPNYPQGKIYSGYEKKSAALSWEGGVKVVRVKPWIVSKDKLVLRLLAEMVFIFRAAASYIKMRTDLIYASSPYMFNGLAFLLLARLMRKRIVWEVRDLTWLYVRALKKDRLGLGRILEKAMVFTGKNVDAIITTTEGQAGYFMEKLNTQRIKCIPNGVSSEHFEIIQRAKGQKLGRFTVVYAGLIGLPQGLKTLLQAAHILPDVDFIIAGDGAERNALEKLAGEKKLQNVRFTGYLSFEEVAGYYKSANVLYAQLRNDPVFGRTQPSKIWEYMAAGKAVIYGGEGVAAEAVRKAKAGLVISPEDHEQLAGAIRELQMDERRCLEFGMNGQKYVRENQIREFIMNDLALYVKEVIG
ncbi:MAG: glycosyltransferase family 4 protein [Peptococcaceae bacterium]|nr:glycosyltransferase family 4 protein [Peptococcaceae bacterium]MDH7524529.1 glycosyltransferase family 4 protein [Peptococcaceae bacterium]